MAPQQDRVRLHTPGWGNDCLLYSIATDLLLQSQFGNEATKFAIAYNSRFSKLQQVLQNQQADLDSKKSWGEYASSLAGIPSVSQAPKINPDKVKDFTALAELPHEEYLRRMGMALRKIAAESLRRSKNLFADDLLQSLLADYELFTKNQTTRVDLFENMEFVTQEFQYCQIPKRLSEKEAADHLTKWWKEKGYDLYVKGIAKESVQLGGVAASAIANELNFTFQYKYQALDKMQTGFDHNSNLTVTAHYNGSNHWSAYSLQSQVDQSNAVKAIVDKKTTLANKAAPTTSNRPNAWKAKTAPTAQDYQNNFAYSGADAARVVQFNDNAYKVIYSKINDEKEHAECSHAYAVVRMFGADKGVAKGIVGEYLNELNKGTDQFSALGFALKELVHVLDDFNAARYKGVKAQLHSESQGRHFAQIFAREVKDKGLGAIHFVDIVEQFRTEVVVHQTKSCFAMFNTKSMEEITMTVMKDDKAETKYNEEELAAETRFSNGEKIRIEQDDDSVKMTAWALTIKACFERLAAYYINLWEKHDADNAKNSKGKLYGVKDPNNNGTLTYKIALTELNPPESFPACKAAFEKLAKDKKIVINLIEPPTVSIAARAA